MSGVHTSTARSSAARAAALARRWGWASVPPVFRALCVSKTRNRERTADALVVDLADAAIVTRGVAEVTVTVGEARQLTVIAAAILGPAGPLDETDLAAWSEVFRVNMLGSCAVSRGDDELFVVGLLPGAVGTKMLAEVRAQGGEAKTTTSVDQAQDSVRALSSATAGERSVRVLHVCGQWTEAPAGRRLLRDEHWERRRVE